MPRALLSVTDKTGLADFGRALAARGFELVSTGGTARTLREAGLPVTDVSDVTGFPEILGGRVKSLHPHVHGGILADLRNPEHGETLREHGIEPFDIVAINLYRFEEAVASGADDDAAMENVDIGGPAMIRAVAKNHANVMVLTDPGQYAQALEEWDNGNPLAFRRECAARAFARTAAYDRAITNYLGDGTELRYGENPHQSARVVAMPGPAGIAQAEQLWGKELSYNNYLDSDGAWSLVNDLPPGSCAVIKHGNPCGVAISGDVFRVARACDPISAFGGIVAIHGPITTELAEAMTEKGNFLEVVIGTEFEPGTMEIFQNKKGWGQNVRLLMAPLLGNATRQTVRSISGGELRQTLDRSSQIPRDGVQTKRQPTEAEWAALDLAWTIVAHVKSNGIVIADGQRLLGVGAGQMNRVQSVRLAIEQAGDAASTGALASDAFFPFPDSIETAHAAGIRAVVQPGGSVKDESVVEAADKFDMALVFTGRRHFRH